MIKLFNQKQSWQSLLSKLVKNSLFKLIKWLCSLFGVILFTLLIAYTIVIRFSEPCSSGIQTIKNNYQQNCHAQPINNPLLVKQNEQLQKKNWLIQSFYKIIVYKTEISIALMIVTFIFLIFSHFSIDAKNQANNNAQDNQFKNPKDKTKEEKLINILIISLSIGIICTGILSLISVFSVFLAYIL